MVVSIVIKEYFSLRTEGNVFLLINERLMLVMGWVQMFWFGFVVA